QMASKIKETPIEEDISLDDLAKLTKLEETALHVAISSYHSELQSPDCEKQIEEMIKSIPDKDAFEILSMKNDKGNTPLHLAAAVGWLSICKCIALRDLKSHFKKQISKRKDKNQTKHFVDGKMGMQFLHSAISGEYFKLAYRIISHYPKLINSVNMEGESPLHVLARKPNVFRSSTHFPFPDSIIYR
ncbi:uncharacterized protein LOC111381954, partial [Olea europaea var. sylvestris]|uniref:uncharacterized protein LOC111381954 n=1 Tax=Olea europaea var. sylvestris TaxID=158386 RepID=UPI000C1D67FC